MYMMSCYVIQLNYIYPHLYLLKRNREEINVITTQMAYEYSTYGTTNAHVTLLTHLWMIFHVEIYYVCINSTLKLIDVFPLTFFLHFFSFCCLVVLLLVYRVYTFQYTQHRITKVKFERQTHSFCTEA